VGRIRIKIRHKYRLYIVSMQVHEECDNDMLAGVLMQQGELEGGLGTVDLSIGLIEHMLRRIQDSSIAGQSLIHMKIKCSPD